MNAERAAGPAGHNLKLKRKNKKNKSASSQAPKRVGPPDKESGQSYEVKMTAKDGAILTGRKL